MPGPLKYRSNLRLHPVNFSNKLYILISINLTKLFWPPFTWPLPATQNFFGPLHFAQPPPPKYLWTLPYKDSASRGEQEVGLSTKNWIKWKTTTTNRKLTSTVPMGWFLSRLVCFCFVLFLFFILVLYCFCLSVFVFVCLFVCLFVFIHLKYNYWIFYPLARTGQETGGGPETIA